MAVYIVSYDLLAPGRNYEALYERLEELKAFRILKSVWLLNSLSSSTAIHDDLKLKLDTNDCLFVGKLDTADLSGSNLPEKTENSLHEWMTLEVLRRMGYRRY